ncbi:SLBB domain-containing protein [candidate division KSB1 bacterium]|nr:SLBB domain-containing protein [candidate division KSB1 bacterium]
MKRLLKIITILFLMLSVNFLAAQELKDITYYQNDNTTGENSDSITGQETLSPETNDLNKKLFGIQFFDQFSIKQSESTGGDVSSDYPLGPGDVLGIYLGDKAQQHFEVRVSADGKIYVPTVGLFNVYGMTMEEFKFQLDKRLERLYSNYIVDVMLITPKQVRISVVGEVKAPGNYSLNALNTALDAVLYAKGPTEDGSLRNIQLYRKDSLITNIDLYDYLLKSKNPQKLYLQNRDRIFVPVLKNMVEVSGEVYRTKIFELLSHKRERLSDLIQLASGFRDMALLEKIELSRLNPDGHRSVYYYDYRKIEKDINSAENVYLQNNDQVHVYSILDRVHKQIVSIYGEVKNPGEYDLEKNLRVSELVLKAGGLTRSAFLLEAEVAKVDPQKPFKISRLELDSVLKGEAPEQDVLLEADDQVFIRRIPQWEVGPLVEIKGQVRFPGFYPIVKDSTFLSQVIKNAGGLTEKANISEAKLFRYSEPVIEDKEFERLKEMRRNEMSEHEYDYFVMKQNSRDVNNIVVDFMKLLTRGDKKEDIILKTGDIIFIPEQPSVVMVTGRVSKNGGIIYKENADFDYYIKKAGGFTWDADSKHTKIIKVTGEIKDDEDVEKFSPGDRIWVPRKPDRDFWRIFRDTMLVAGQLATIYLVIEGAIE